MTKTRSNVAAALPPVNLPDGYWNGRGRMQANYDRVFAKVGHLDATHINTPPCVTPFWIVSYLYHAWVMPRANDWVNIRDNDFCRWLDQWREELESNLKYFGVTPETWVRFLTTSKEICSSYKVDQTWLQSFANLQPEMALVVENITSAVVVWVEFQLRSRR